MKFAKKISPETIRKLAELPVPWGPTGYITYKRTYARAREDLGRTEEWHETIERGCNGLLEIGAVFTESQIDQFAYNWHQLKGCPAGRPIWQLGTETVRRLGGNSLNNCWCVNVNDPIKPFTFAFNQLMLGGGVGFNITPESVFELPPVKHAPRVQRADDFDCDFIVPDNREGWVELLRRVLEAFFFTGKTLRYDTRCIRPKGRPIHGFGGIASGPEDLVRGIATISGILTQAKGRKLKPVECLDIMNVIGSVVVAGNVRRSAEVAIGDAYDREFLDAKNWGKGSIPPWRQQSNNTVSSADTSRLPKAFWRGYEGNGESYGLFNLPLFRSHGRLVDGVGYRPDPDVIGGNPCMEIGLANKEPCNLAEQFLPNLRDVGEFAEVSALLLRAAKAITTLDYIDDETTEIVHKNRRVGLSVTGYQQATHFRGHAESFDRVYKHLEEEDRHLSREMGINPSIKLTTVKPSGTLSLLAGCTPGMHAAYAPYYIRRITFAAGNPLVDVARARGFKAAPRINIDGTKDHSSLIADFPSYTPEGTRCAGDYPAIDQLEDQKFLQAHWADNSVSATIYYRKHELPAIKEWLAANYKDGVKATSFLLHSDHGFLQAPYEEVTEAQYNRLASKVCPLVGLTPDEQVDLYRYLRHDSGDDSTSDCGAGGCPIK